MHARRAGVLRSPPVFAALQDFDRIVVMQNGRIAQDGPPDELELLQGPYRDLLRRQGFRVVENAA